MANRRTENSDLTADELRGKVKTMIEAEGAAAAARKLGIHAQTALAIAAGVSVRPGSLALVRESFRR
jgi:hypothetical protein